MRKIIALVALLALTSCAAAQAPPAPAEPLPPPGPLAHVSFVGDDVIKERSFDDLGDRVREKVTLRNNARLTYVKLKGIVYPGTFSDADALAVDMGQPFFKVRNISFDRAKVKTSGPFTYLMQSTSIFHCFVFHHNFGEGVPRGDQQIRGTACNPVTSKDPGTLEREMLELLSRLRIDGKPVPADVVSAK